MKILPANNGIVIRIEYYNPYPPEVGYYTFYGAGNTAEEIILELCKMKKIPLPYIRDKCIICTIDTITTGLTDYLITTYHEDYHERVRQQRKNMDNYLKSNPTKPFNSVFKREDKIIYSVL